MQHLSSNESIEKKIDQIYMDLNEKKIEFAHLVANGKKKSPAFKEVWEYFDVIQVNRLMMGKTGELIGLLKLSSKEFIRSRHVADRRERLEGMTQLYYEGMSNYQNTGEAAHGAVAIKAVNTLNAMTGENAPEEVHHLVEITSAQLENMSHSDRTQAYKRMMGGHLTLVDDVVEVPDEEIKAVKVVQLPDDIVMGEPN